MKIEDLVCHNEDPAQPNKYFFKKEAAAASTISLQLWGELWANETGVCIPVQILSRTVV